MMGPLERAADPTPWLYCLGQIARVERQNAERDGANELAKKLSEIETWCLKAAEKMRKRNERHSLRL